MRIDPRYRFPDPRLAAHHGLVAVGGDFRPERLIAAYARGIFPWPSPELRHAWFSPDPRLVLVPSQLHVSRSLRRVLRREEFEVRYDSAFARVVAGCVAHQRPDADGTWITPELIDGFVALHRLGLAHSVETWQQGRLVGGLYGVSLGGMFCGESMFFHRTNASKIALVALVGRLVAWRHSFLDCQVYSQHLAHFGAQLWPRDRFLDALESALAQPTRRGPWPAAEPRELDAELP